MSSIAEQIRMKSSIRETEVALSLRPAPNRLSAVLRFIRQKPLGALGGLLVIVFIFTALFHEQIAPYPYDTGKAENRLQLPSAQFLLGTDNVGRDMFSRIVWGADTSVKVGFGAVLFGTGLATILGILSGYWGGKFDLILQRFIDIWISIPPIVLVITMVSIFTTRNTDSDASIVLIAVTIGLVVAAGSTRVVRSAVIGIRQMPYMEAGRSLGCKDRRIILRYVLPNVFATILILATTQLGAAILAEATIAFLGFGVKPPLPAWGSMLSGNGRQFFLVAPWLAIWPGLAISLAVFGFNMFGDALRDVLDPRLRGSR